MSRRGGSERAHGARLRIMLMIALCLGSLGLVGFDDPAIEVIDVYDQRGKNYQRDLPRPPQGAGAGSPGVGDPKTASGRSRGARRNVSPDAFSGGGSGDSYTSDSGLGSGNETGSGSGSGGTITFGGGGGGGPEVHGEFRPTDAQITEQRAERMGSAGGGGAGGLDVEFSGSGSGSFDGSSSGGGGRGGELGGGTGGTGGGEDGAGGDAGVGAGGGGGEMAGGGQAGPGQGGDAHGGERGGAQGAGPSASPGERQPTTTPQPPKPKRPKPKPPEVEKPDQPEPRDTPKQGISDVLRTLAIVLMALMALLLVGALVRYLIDRRAADAAVAASEEQDEADVLDELRARTRHRPHEELAQELDYDAAVHALLLSALEILVARDPQLRTPSLTSRKLLDGADLAPEATPHLRRLVVAVELCVFARRPATAQMYQTCLEAHAAFMRLLEQPGADGEVGS